MTSMGKRATPPCQPQAEHSGTADPPAAANAIDQAVALRDSLRKAAANTAELIRTLRRDKRLARQFKSARAARRHIASSSV